MNDQDGNGKPDDQDAALKQAQDLVAAAEGKQTEAENALTEANKDGAINQAEHDDLTGKNQAVTEAKTPAQAAVDALPDGQEKSELQNRLDAVDGITVPAVNDQDGNGKPDDQDAALKQAQDLVAAAEGKQTEAENALTEANKDGAINQAEHDDLTGKNQAVTEAKTPAQAAVDALPDGQEKSELQNRLDAVDGITVPAVNDQDGNGKPDDQDAALKQAQDLVAAAEGKQTEAENALTEANKDGAINQAEHDDLTGKNQAVTEAKTPAQAAVDALPDGQEKSELQNRLDAVDGITVPAVNDQDGNGKPDDQDAALKQAQDLVAAAEGKQTEAENALTEANKDGAINQAEHDDLTGKNQAVTEAKTPAQAAVDALPDGQEKSELQNRLDAVDGITVPAVNDQDGNGKPDDQDAALKQAQDLVAAAEGKQTEAENALTEANKDGAINQAEHDDLTGKNQAVTEAKTPAQAAVDALPDGQEKSELQNRLDAVDGITVPAVNDQDGNGKPDDQDAALKQAQDLVAAAEGKQTEAENALTEANKDGAINQAEHDDLTGKNQAVTEAKTPAQAAVDALPDGQEKSELQNRLDAVDGITVPAVNDQDGNGKPDDQDAALKQAQDLVAAAEGKQTEAENALTEANKDGAINQAEHDDLTGKNQAVTEAKTPAQAAVDALPDGQEKSELQNRLDAVDGITVPAVNDQDGNGKPDDQDAALKQAQDLVAAAEGKQTEAENALTEANKDGAINQAEHDDLTGKNQAVTEAKTPAQAAVDALPDGQEKSELQNRLDAVDGITVPAVNDQDGNGKPDDQDAALKQAQDLVAAAEGKQTEAENALTEANKDGAINQAEHDDLTGKNQAVTEAKTPAQAAVDALPDGQEKSELQNRLDAVDGITVPAVNDQDGNGKPDDQDAALKQAQDLVAAAEGKQTEAENALTEANKDGAINQAEHDDLTGKNQAVTEAKTPAQAAVDALPDGQEKSELQNRLDAVDGITVPAVNDQDGNGKPDDQDAQEAFENAKVHVEKALNTVYQTNDDLYAKYAASFNKPAGNVDGSTTLWKPVLNKNNGAYFSSAKNAVGEFKYIYNGLNDTDIISTKYSIGGTGRSMTTRNDMDILTGEGDDIIAVGQDIGRSYSTGYTDKKYLTDMGDGNDILFVGLSNENVQINLRADGSLRAIKKGDYFTSGEIINVSGDYDSDSGGVISSTTIKMGNGDDTILALGWSDGGNAVQNSIIELGSGNDTMQVNGTIEASKIDGGAGFDTLIISNGTISSESFTGFEKIELMSSGHLVLHSKDFSNHDIGGILKVTGETGSSVNIQDFNWQQGRLGRIEEDGVSYTTYISAEYPDLSLWVQDGIDIR
ncbi:Domain of uncharacterised function (DUF1707) [Escherichia coli]|uniref:Domain of uncharacterized function (DUF1707) n=3 Tax=Escherichia coli TaxID=562 RepID=A0A376ZR05_ECOLX|nr:Domain of uncharacterised function (DUF1707) [Escherichia coli]